MVYDCSGYVTKYNVKCSDGRTLRHGAFNDDNGQRVPCVWNHQRNSPDNILGYVSLEHRDDGVYGYVKFNETEAGMLAKQLVEHGDISAFSIYANKLTQRGGDVLHGRIREVSLVLAGANSEALIDDLNVEHGDRSEDRTDGEALIYTAFDIGTDDVEHEDKSNTENQNGSEEKVADVEHTEEKTVKEVFDSLTDEQKNVVYAMLGYALEQSDENEDEEDVEHSEEEDDDLEHNDEGGDTMKKNVFEDTDKIENTLSHDEMLAIFKDGPRYGSMKEAVLQHGITDIDVLFPEAKAVNTTPDMIMREQEWVAKVWNATRKSPFSRIKSTAADLTMDEARARGYIKGKQKVEEQFSVMKRVTTPTTVYKKQALDRDDIIDITDFDVVAWLKAEMRLMLNEELARAILIGDGRSISSDDKINEQNIRPIYTDNELYTIHYTVDQSQTDETEKANAIIDAAHRARKNYRGSGAPTFYIDVDSLTTLLLARDKIGHRLYNTVGELASALRVKEIVEVPVMENQTRTVSDDDGKTNTTMALIGIMVNLTDYTVGADKGGAVSMFDDFDIDYNKEKYLIETRMSGALTRPKSAVVLEYEVTTPTPTPPTPPAG